MGRGRNVDTQMVVTADIAHALVQVMAIIESRFEVFDGLPSRCAQTGEEYDVLLIGGIHQEGVEAPRAVASTPEQAIQFWLKSFEEYAAGKSGKLYWRIRPEVSRIGNQFAVYARLLISNNPWLAKPAF